MKKINNADMRLYTSFRAGGAADEMIICENAEELQEALASLEAEGRPHFLLGNGSNVLFRDEGYRGAVVKMAGEFQEIRLDEKEEGLIHAGAAALMPQVGSFALEHGLAGFENMSGIPGSVGGAVFMDAGAYGTEMKDVLESADILLDGKIVNVPAEELDLSYRHSVLEENGGIALFAHIRLTPGDPEEISAKMKEVARKRNEKQPLNYPSAGSTFKRPAGYFAGKLIQDSGLRGVQVGGAQVSEKHCGFVINRGGATAGDILDLMNLVENTVRDQFGVQLEPEVRIIGPNGPENGEKQE